MKFCQLSVRSVKQILLIQGGCEARKIPARGGVFFLDFLLCRTNRELHPLLLQSKT